MSLAGSDIINVNKQSRRLKGINRFVMVKMKESITVTKQLSNKVIGYGFDDSDGVKHFADINDDGQVIHRHSDSSPQGEETSQIACEILVQKKNELGDDWTKPIQSTGVVDFVSKSKCNTRSELWMQVVRANVNNNYWQKLNIEKTLAEKIDSIEEICKMIKESIDLKLKKIPEVSRKGLTLVLDATVLPQLCMSDAVECFRTKYADVLRATGFDEIWLVGPNHLMTFQIC